MDTLPGTQFTDDWMQNPWGMTDASQLTNPYSNYYGAAMPWPPTYSEGNMGGPVNAATGKPIQSYQDWKAANPAGMTLNATPQQPQAASTGTGLDAALGAMGMTQFGQQMADKGISQQDIAGLIGLPGVQNIMGQQAAPQPQVGPQPSGPPNNWQAALQSLANPGNPTTQGATVPQVNGYQPAGGVNQAFMQQAQGRPGMNQNFMSALSAIQGRPQQKFG